ncbi:hypothetical protein LPJ81_000848 [Coemansia sp. IMI 209127]|nr:hypothetical protein LPJ81_000848 [Coemansia sp. IMI 209127]
MIRNSGTSLLCSIHALYKRPRQACSRYYSSQTSNDDDEKGHLSRLASFADTISHDVLDEDQIKTKERERQPQPTELPAFESMTSGRNSRAQKTVGEDEEPERIGEWTKEEEMRLIEVVDKCRNTWNAPINWNDVNSHFTHRTIKSCRLRYTVMMRSQKGEQDFQINIDHSREWTHLEPKELEMLEEGVRIVWRAVVEKGGHARKEYYGDDQKLAGTYAYVVCCVMS